MAMTREVGELTLTDAGQHGFGERIDRSGEPIGFIHEGMVHGGYYARAIKGKGVYCERTFHATEREAIAAAVAAHDAPEPDPADAESAAAREAEDAPEDEERG